MMSAEPTKKKAAGAKKAPAKPIDVRGTPASDPFYQAAHEALERANDAMADRTHAIDNFAAEVSLSNELLVRIDDQLGRFALRHDVTRRRRVTTIRLAYLLLCSFVVMIGLMSWKVERCSPGARAQRVFVTILGNDVRLDNIRDTIRTPVSPACDIAFPLYPHKVGADWPTPGNTAGLALYAAAVAAGGIASRRRPWEHPHTHPERTSA